MSHDHEEEEKHHEEEEEEKPSLYQVPLNDQSRQMSDAIARALSKYRPRDSSTIHRVMCRKEYNGVSYHDIEEYAVHPVDKLTTYIDPQRKRVMLSIYPSEQEENHRIPRPVIMMTEKDLCKLILSLQCTLQDLRQIRSDAPMHGQPSRPVQIDESHRMGEELHTDDDVPSRSDLTKMRRRQDDPDYDDTEDNDDDDDDSWYD